MDPAIDLSRPNLSLATRILALSGYQIENTKRQPTHAELQCRAPVLSTTVPLLIALTEDDELPPKAFEQITIVARKENRTLVIVGTVATDAQMAWQDFLDRFGGAVPSWRALSDSYLQQLETASKNRLPTGLTGEPWRIFEQLVADGMEFCLGRSVRRLGAKKRGQKVSDLITQIPEGQVLVIDAKASEGQFNAAIHELRALAEYTRNQRLRQKGFNEVIGALIVAREFKQARTSLANISREFLAETQVPAAFLQVSSICHLVTTFKEEPHLRARPQVAAHIFGGTGD